MKGSSKTQIAAIVDQLLVLRESVNILREMEAENVSSLRGHQTMDVDGAFDLVFDKLQGDIAGMEEALATIAEATGDVPKF